MSTVLPEGIMQGYCIPDLEFDLFATGCDDFGTEFHADGGVMIELEFFLQELQQDARFPDALYLDHGYWYHRSR